MRSRALSLFFFTVGKSGQGIKWMEEIGGVSNRNYFVVSEDKTLTQSKGHGRNTSLR